MIVRLVAVPAAALALMAVAGAHTSAPAAAGAPGGPPRTLAVPIRAAWVLTQPYGCTTFALEPVAPWCPTGHFHSGIDMAAPAGTPVLAAAAGVVHVADDPNGYGLHVVVDHGGGVATLYGHLSEVDAAEGESVGAGEQVGQVGTSGLSTGPHLHFEVRRGGRPVDPQPWLPPATTAFEEVTPWSTR